MSRDALRPSFMAVMDLLADPVPVAGAVSLDVEVPVSGVRRVRTGPQNGCEPTACSGSQGCENSDFPVISLASAIERTSPFASSKLTISTARAAGMWH